jgi:hypothetical protein
MMGRVYAKFHEDWYRRSGNIKVLLQNLRVCNVGIADDKVL